MIFGAVTIALLMFSSATAVPQVNSEPVMEKISAIDMDELLSCYTSIEFAEYLHEDENQDFLYSDWYLDFYNSDNVQNFINTDNFQLFLTSDICQIFLNNYYNVNESIPSVYNNQEIIVNIQQLEKTTTIPQTTQNIITGTWLMASG